MQEVDLYKILGVSKSSDAKNIKSAYRKIARENHPDLNPDDNAAEERFKKASYAFEVLGDEKKRALYDEFGAQGLRDGFDADSARRYGFAGSGASHSWNYTQDKSGRYQDVFSNIFGGKSPFDTSDFSQFGGFQTAPTKGRDISAQIQVDFLKAVNGGTLEFELQGKSIRSRIPQGARDQEKLRLKGKGHPAPSGAPAGTKAGDLLLTLNVEDHPYFRRDGLDISIDLPIRVSEAITGSTVDVPTPHGIYKVKVPAGVHSGAKLRLRSKGVQRGSKQGNFFAIVQIHSPDHIDPKLETLAKKLDRGYTTDPRESLKEP